MKRPHVQLLLASLIAVFLAACSQTATLPTPNAQPSAEANQLLARAMAHSGTRKYIAERLQRDEEDAFAEMTTEQLHSPAFYDVLADALGEDVAEVEAAFRTLPNAYLVMPVHFKTWDPSAEVPLVAYLSNGATVRETVTALDADLAPHVLSTEQSPEQVVLVLHEGFTAEPDTLSTQSISCTLPSHRGLFETRTTTMVDVKGKGQRGVAREEARPGWVIQNADISVSRDGNAGASKSLVNAGSKFIYLEQLKQVRNLNLDLSGSYGENEAAIKAVINSTYDIFVKYTTETVTEQTLAVEWYVNSSWLLFGSKLKVVATIREMCNNVNAISVPKTDVVFKSEMARVAGGGTPTPPPATTGKLSFSVNPSNVSASLTVKGNGATYSASRSTVLTLAPGTYTVNGYGYDSSNREYTMSAQTVSVTAGGSKTLSVYMQPLPGECGIPSEPTPIICP